MHFNIACCIFSLAFFAFGFSAFFFWTGGDRKRHTIQAIQDSQCSGRELVRLQCQHSPSIGPWLSDIHSSALGTEICPPIYRILLRWWLGLSVAASSGDADVPLKCPFCDGAMDAFGDHLLCCNKTEFYTRHHAVVKCLTTFVAVAGVRATTPCGFLFGSLDDSGTGDSGHAPVGDSVCARLKKRRLPKSGRKSPNMPT